MKKILIILGILLLSVSLASAALCKYPDGYYHDCTHYYGSGDQTWYYHGYRNGFEDGYTIGQKKYFSGYFDKKEIRDTPRCYLYKWYYRHL